MTIDGMTIREDNTSVSARWATEAEADRALAYMRAHERGQTAMVWALSRVMSWREAYAACFAYVSMQVGVTLPTITFE